VLQVYLQDTAKAYVLQGNGEYVPRSAFVEDGVPLFNSQSWLMKHSVAQVDGRLD
jgi:hypothetical protein